MKLYKIIFILSVVISIQGFGQTIDLRNEDEVNAAYGASNYIYWGKCSLNNPSLTREEIISRFEIELKTSLAKKIISNVKVENKSKSVQLNITDNLNSKNNSVKEEIKFEFYTNIESEITFREPKTIFKEDAVKKVLYGLIYIDKVDFLEQNFGRINYNLNKLVGEVGELLDKSNNRVLQLKYNEFLKERNKIYSLIEVQNILEPGRARGDQDLVKKVQELDSKLTQLLSNLESAKFQEDLYTAKQKLYNKDYRGAMSDFARLAINYPGNETVGIEKDSALNLISEDYKYKIVSNDYLYALESIKYLESLDQSFVAKYFETKNILIKNAFESYMTKSEASVSNKDYKEAKLLIEKIREFRYFDGNRFDRLERRIDDNIFKDKLNEIDYKISNKSFLDAYQLILNVKKEYPLRNMTEVIQREDDVVNELTDIKVGEVKSKRPLTWQVQVGGGLISNFYSLPASNVNNYTVATASSIGEIGLYKKIGIRQFDLGQNKPMFTSNAVGVRLTVWFPNQLFKSTLSGASQYDAGLFFKTNVYEPQLSFFTLRMFNLNFGKIVGEIIDVNSNQPINVEKDYYTFTLGIRPRLGNLMLHINAKLISDLDQKNYVTLQSSINFALNFHRRFKASERAEIRNAIQQVKNLY
ncbi:MAG: hypothetical protein VKL60_12975 [Sphaerospermopsis sp.]|nr:hypothetical protein [Sphaerospermopsis sp.]